MHALLRFVPALAAILLFAGSLAFAQQDPSQIKPPSDAVVLGIFLRHTQQLTLEEMGAKFRERGFWKVFPPEGVKVLGWYQLMSQGHFIFVECPPVKIRELNRAIESVSYGLFKSEVFPGYDFWPIAQARMAQERK
jgi:hypothetical protein